MLGRQHEACGSKGVETPDFDQLGAADADFIDRARAERTVGVPHVAGTVVDHLGGVAEVAQNRLHGIRLQNGAVIAGAMECEYSDFLWAHGASFSCARINDQTGISVAEEGLIDKVVLRENEGPRITADAFVQANQSLPQHICQAAAGLT